MGSGGSGIVRAAISTIQVEKVNLVKNRGIRAGVLLVALVALAAIAAGCGASSSASGGGKLALVAYSTPQEAYAQLIPAFKKTAGGKGVSFSQSYGASGDQSRAVASGLPADVVEFSLEPDITKLVKAGLVSSSWDQNKWHGFVTDSVVTLVVRKGNPKGIHDWSDLIKPGVQVIEPNPFTSGGARWNVMAAYGAQIKQGQTPSQAQAYLQQLFKRVVVQDKSARDAMNTFTSGKGDVLIAYENEAINAQQKGKAVEYVTPKDTILIQNPIAVTKDAAPDAQKFVNWLYSDAAQKIFAARGYRPVVPSLVNQSKYPTPSGLFTINDVGGWDKVMTDFFDPSNGIVAKIEQGLGVSTAKS
jgi:sulfate transport system substrate-binding protein